MQGTQRTCPMQQSYGFGLFQSCVINSGATFTHRAAIHHFQLLIQAEVEESIHCYTTAAFPPLWQNPAGMQALQAGLHSVLSKDLHNSGS